MLVSVLSGWKRKVGMVRRVLYGLLTKYGSISLVHSSLEAVGLTAIVSGKLAAYEISANVIAGYYHDHIFVPEQFADEALERVRNLKKL